MERCRARGTTILYGRGTGESEIQKFLNIHVEASKEIILIVWENENYTDIYNKVIEMDKLKKPGTGITFTLPMKNLVGLHHRKFLIRMKKSRRDCPRLFSI
ncbi:MAG TPA: P-II family nitrogen regulator [Tissierellales bacterium]|nr:P-II family nitrogen regulator [Tissierellales bacterium]